jgi:biopolymer transport protein TolR
LAGTLSTGEGTRRRRRQRQRPLSEINVTPFVDVMLVLLIVFMITAPLLATGVPVDLPETEAAGLTPGNEPITVTVNADGQIYVGDTETTMDQLVPLLMEQAAGDLEQRVFVRGDRASSYGAMMAVMGTINGAGFTRIGLVTLPDTN